VDINRGNRTRNIIINGSNAIINAGTNVRIDDLTVNGENARINLASGARLDKAELNAKTAVSGSGGSVGALNINPGGGGSHIEPRPDSTTATPGENVTTGSPPPPPPVANGGNGGQDRVRGWHIGQLPIDGYRAGGGGDGRYRR
jgi:hypothetical protein